MPLVTQSCNKSHLDICRSELDDRSLDSFSHLVLPFVSRVETTVGTRVFAVAAPTLWNSLPVSVRSVGNIATFCLHLKTFLFNLVYPL